MAADRKRSADTRKVLIFVPPKICLHDTEKTAKLDAQDLPEVKWDKTYFKFDGHNFVIDDEATTPNDLENQNTSRIDSEVSAASGIVLDYDPELVHESINSYLDEEFFQANQTTALCNSLAPIESLLTHDKVGGFDRLQREYEVMTFESQLLLGNSISDRSSSSLGVSRGRAQQSSDENTHQLTEDDVYTQLSPGKRHESPLLFSQPTASESVSKEGKKERENCGKTTVPGKPIVYPGNTPDLGTSKIQTNNVVHKRGRALPNISDKLSYLAKCNKNDLVNVCVIVLQVNPVKEIQIKSGRNRGEYIPLSSVIVADVSKSHFKITLWRQASCWTERIVPGDIIIATSIRIETWRDENIGQTTFHSCFYNLHQPAKPLSHDWLQLVSQERLDELLKQAGQDYGYLFRNTTVSAATRQQVKFCRISEMKNNTLVHFRGVLRKVEVMETQTNGGTYQFGNQRLPKIRIVFAEISQEDEIIVTLWGRQAQWLQDLRTAEGTVWELQYLTAKHDASSATMVLHTTPKSTKVKLTEENLDAKRLLSIFGEFPSEVKAFKSIKDVLDAKFSGSAEIRGFISEIVFYPDTKEELTINCSADVEVLNDCVPLLTYIGCASCFRPLIQDENQIYGQCVHCVHHKPDYNYRVERFYRNFTMKITDSRNNIDVHVKHGAACKLFKGILASQLTKRKQDHNSGKIQEFVERVKELVSGKEKSRIILSCQTILDENSFVVSRSFTLIDN